MGDTDLEYSSEDQSQFLNVDSIGVADEQLNCFYTLNNIGRWNLNPYRGTEIIHSSPPSLLFLGRVCMCEILRKHKMVSRYLLELNESEFFGGGVQQKSLCTILQ